MINKSGIESGYNDRPKSVCNKRNARDGVA